MARRNFRIELNTAMPIFRAMKFGTWLQGLVASFNASVNTDNATASAVLSTPGLVINAGGALIAKAGSAFAALANGVLVYVVANTAMPALAGVIATTKFAAWAFYIDSAGTITVSAKTADAATLAAAVALVPAPPVGKAMIGFIVVQNATGGNFTGGTTALDAASITTTYVNTVGPTLFAANNLSSVIVLPDAIVPDQA